MPTTPKTTTEKTTKTTTTRGVKNIILFFLISVSYKSQNLTFFKDPNAPTVIVPVVVEPEAIINEYGEKLIFIDEFDTFDFKKVNKKEELITTMV